MTVLHGGGSSPGSYRSFTSSSERVVQGVERVDGDEHLTELAMQRTGGGIRSSSVWVSFVVISKAAVLDMCASSSACSAQFVDGIFTMTGVSADRSMAPATQ